MRECRRPFGVTGIVGHDSEECRQLVNATVKTILKSMNIDTMKVIPFSTDSSCTVAAFEEHMSTSSGSFQVVFFSGVVIPFQIDEIVRCTKARKTLIIIDCAVAVSLCAKAMEGVPRFKDILIVGTPPSATGVTAPSMALSLAHVLTILESSVPTTFGQVYDSLSFFRYRVKEAMPFYMATTALVIDLDASTTQMPIMSFDGDSVHVDGAPTQPRQQLQITKMECQLRLLEQIRVFPGQRSIDYARILSVEKKTVALVLAELEKQGKVAKRDFPTNPNRDMEATLARPGPPRWFPA